MADLSLLLALLTKTWVWTLLGLIALAMLIPTAGIFHADQSIGRIILTVYSAMLAICGLTAFMLVLTGAPLGMGLSLIPAGLFILGWTAFTWIASLVIHLTREQA